MINTLDAKKLIEYSELDAKEYIHSILSYELSDWFNFVQANNKLIGTIESGNIPQFSNIEDGTINVVSAIRKVGNPGVPYEKVGRYLLPTGKNKVAYYKYGENHSKLAQQLSLLKVKREGRVGLNYLSEIGAVFDALTREEKDAYILRQLLTIPIIDYIVFSKEKIEIKEELSQYLNSAKTVDRRTSNVRSIISIIANNYGEVVSLDPFVNL